MRCLQARQVLPVLLLLACAACSQKPDVTYDPPIQFADLAAELPAPDNGYLLLADERTVDRFACALAVVKLAPAEHNGGYHLAYRPMDTMEQVRWCERMRGLPSIREVIFLKPTALKSGGEDFDGLCAAAEALGARLLLMYAPNGIGPNSAQVWAVLYALPSRAPLATFHASACYLDDEDEETSPNAWEGDHRDVDARYQAHRAVEQQVLACIRDLVALDQPAPTTQPHDDWDTPFLERWWLPVRRR